jgi:peroxiredoxin
MKAKAGVDYPVVYDDNLAMAKNMGLLHKGANPIKNTDLAQPATFLFDAEGKIIWSYVSTNYRIRPETMDIFAAAEEHFGG